MIQGSIDKRKFVYLKKWSQDRVCFVTRTLKIKSKKDTQKTHVKMKWDLASYRF